VATLYSLGRGIPGLMNTLADNALFEAFLCGRSSVSDVDVQRAHRDLGWENPSADAVQTEPSAEPASPPVAPRPAVAAPDLSSPVLAPSATAASNPIPTSSEIDSSDPFELSEVVEPGSGEPLLDALDSDLEAIFELSGSGDAAAASELPPRTALRFSDDELDSEFFDAKEEPPKEEPEVLDDLLVELVDS
jgi:hypothetical protein